MKYQYMIWATGEDSPGIVAAVTKELYEHRCNLEDSSMMRLGGEFAILIIFSSPQNKVSEKWFSTVEKKYGLTIGLKSLTTSQARFKTIKKNLFLVTIHGVDRPGLVYKVTRVLAEHKFNITDLSTHRTTSGPTAGYILFIEGEMAYPVQKLERSLLKLRRRLKTILSIRQITTDSI